MLYTYAITVMNIFGSGKPHYSTAPFFTAELSKSLILIMVQGNIAIAIFNTILMIGPTGRVTVTGRRDNEYTLSVSWDTLSLEEARGYITIYNINLSVYNGYCTLPVTNITVSANNTNYTTSDPLVPYLSYCITVSAQNTIGTGPASNLLIINSKYH